MWQPARVRCRIDGHDVWEGSLNNVFIANGRYQGAGMRVAPGALMDDGRLDVAILPSLPLAETLPMLPGLYRGTWQEHPAVHVSQGSEVEITVLSGQIFADIDGEDGGRGSARVRCLPRALGLTGVPGWAREVGG
jgi:diacylglycerol kinase family enzyme